MAFDINGTLDGMLKAGLGVLTGELPGLGDCVKQALLEEKDALKAIAEARLKGEINDDQMKSELEDEVETLEAAILACKVKAEAAAQKAVQAMLKFFQDAVKAALP